MRVNKKSLPGQLLNCQVAAAPYVNEDETDIASASRNCRCRWFAMTGLQIPFNLRALSRLRSATDVVHTPENHSLTYTI